MRIAVCDYAGHPFQIQLSRHLASRGHQVLHLYFADLVGPKGAIQRLPDDPLGFAIEGITAGAHVNRTDLLRRRQQEAHAGKLFATRCRDFGPDAIISSNMPLDALPHLQTQARRSEATFILWLQDVISLAMESILGKRGYFYRLVSKYYGLRERRALRRSDAVVAISDDFLPILRRWRIDPARISIIPNWAPIGDIPVGHKRNDWSRKHGVESGRLILYAGTLGFKHSPRKLVDLAEAIKRHPDTKILVASEGTGADYLKAEIGERGLTNLQVIPFQPMEQFPNMLASADLLVVLIERDAGVFSVPSKLLSYLCAKRAVLLSVPRENLAARIVAETGAGLVVDPDDDEGFVSAAMQLIEDGGVRERCAVAGRQYAEQTFDIESIARRFESALSARMTTPGRSASRLRELGRAA